MKRRALFTPLVTLDNKGKIEVDWGDSYQSTTYDDGTEVHEDPVMTDRFDAILGFKEEVSPPNSVERLRNLADYIERQSA